MARNRAGHFVANASDRFVVGEGDLRCFNDGAAVAGSIAQPTINGLPNLESLVLVLRGLYQRRDDIRATVL